MLEVKTSGYINLYNIIEERAVIMWWATIIAYGYYGCIQSYASVLKILGI